VSAPSSVTTWLARLRDGDLEAARPLFQRYHEKLLHLARAHLSKRLRRVADEEDVVQSAFFSFCAAARAGRFPHLENRDDLWRLLYTFTLRKVCQVARREDAERRGGGKVRPAVDLFDLPEADLAVLASADPDPALAAELADLLEHLLARLTLPNLRQTALLLLEGDTTAEAALKMNCSIRAIQRRRERIFAMWMEEASPDK
jgi:DNA-directed RNA polymerase specialized sigma24 family protein